MMSDKTSWSDSPMDAVVQREKRIYLARFEDDPERPSGHVVLDDGVKYPVALLGEILVTAVVGDKKGRLKITAADFLRVAVQAYLTEQLGLGEFISLTGPSSPEDSDHFELRIFYPLLRELEERPITELSPLGTLRGKLSWISGVPDTLEYLPVTFVLDGATADKGRVATVSFERSVEFQLLSPQPQMMMFAAAPAPQANNKEVYIRFIHDTNQDVEQLKIDLVNGANQVWNQPGGVEVIVKADEATTIPVTLSDQFASSAKHNGGVTYNSGANDAQIQLQVDFAQNNIYLLAHELGHALGLCHPGFDPCPLEGVRASHCSVMVPSVPSSSRNTAHNLSVVNKPTQMIMPDRLVTVGYTTATPVFYHMIRNFPYDDGVQPFPGNTWGKESDIWNWDSQVPQPNPGGTFHLHKQPSPNAPNFLFVRLHACEWLFNRVEVYLFVAKLDNNNQQRQIFLLDTASQNPLLFDNTVPDSALPQPGEPVILNTSWVLPPQWTNDCWLLAMSRSNQDDAGVTEFVSNASTAANPIVKSVDELINLAQFFNNIAIRRPDHDNTPLPLFAPPPPPPIT